jgi:hypothetical protein
MKTNKQTEKEVYQICPKARELWRQYDCGDPTLTHRETYV